MRHTCPTDCTYRCTVKQYIQLSLMNPSVSESWLTYSYKRTYYQSLTCVCTYGEQEKSGVNKPELRWKDVVPSTVVNEALSVSEEIGRVATSYIPSDWRLFTYISISKEAVQYLS
ncbi:hypothetical protein J6590_068818 [Homalodisca vitripennis]|nr:hypothetical protein J6590_068818 [Homalodisca vitripennis]